MASKIVFQQGPQLGGAYPHDQETGAEGATCWVDKLCDGDLPATNSAAAMADMPGESQCQTRSSQGGHQSTWECFVSSAGGCIRIGMLGVCGRGEQACGGRMLGRKRSENDSRTHRHPEGSVGWLGDVVTE